METEEEWEQKIEEWEQKIRTAFFEYARDNELPVSILLIISQGKY